MWLDITFRTRHTQKQDMGPETVHTAIWCVIKVACQIISENTDFVTNGVGTTGKPLERVKIGPTFPKHQDHL